MAKGRPPKAEGDRKTNLLRIPLTDDEKQLVTRAASLSRQEMAAWARPILLDAARAIIAASEDRKPKKKPG